MEHDVCAPCPVIRVFRYSCGAAGPSPRRACASVPAASPGNRQQNVCRGGECSVTVSEHAMYDDGVLRITRSGRPPVVTLAGEIDEATYPGLMIALERVADGQSEVHFDLGGVEYCDLAGLRAIVCVTGADRDG